MPYPSFHFLLAMSGPLFTSERWSMGLRLTRGPGFENPGDLEALKENLAGRIATWWTGAPIGGQARLDTVKCNLIGLDGKYASKSQTYLKEWASPIGTGQAARTAPQVSLAITLLTESKRGLASRGRIFLPQPSFSEIGADGRLTTTFRGQVNTSMVALVNSLNAAAPGVRVCVASDVREGAIRPVTHVATGLVLDTMRSRRHALPEDRLPAAVTPPSP